jgi:hypothetical protein
MPVIVNGRTYYRTAEVCRIAGISKTTFFRWVRDDNSKEADIRDRRGWRLFTETELGKFREEANRTIDNDQFRSVKII